MKNLIKWWFQEISLKHKTKMLAKQKAMSWKHKEAK